MTTIVVVHASAAAVSAALHWAREGIPSLEWSLADVLEPERQRVTLTAAQPEELLDVIELLRRQFGTKEISPSP